MVARGLRGGGGGSWGWRGVENYSGEGLGVFVGEAWDGCVFAGWCGLGALMGVRVLGKVAEPGGRRRADARAESEGVA